MVQNMENDAFQHYKIGICPVENAVETVNNYWMC